MNLNRKKKKALKKAKGKADRPASRPLVSPEAIIKTTFFEASDILARRAEYLRTVSRSEESDRAALGCFGHAITLSRAARLLPERLVKKILKVAK